MGVSEIPSSVIVLAILLISRSLHGVSSFNDVSVSCMMVYDDGGAPAVLESPECSLWLLSRESLQNQTLNCQFATLQGRRKHQEDRIACDLDMKISLPGGNEHKDVAVGIVAVFDGHGGQEASEMASRLFFSYFHLHAIFKTYKLMVLYKGDLSSTNNQLLRLEILREALVATVHDIDLRFSQEAIKSNFFSGSTATVGLIFEGQILVANVGDSKAILYSEKIGSSQEAGGNSSPNLLASPLTEDHHPDRDDEKARIEAAGGSVSAISWDVPRVNGMLAMSRSIGNVYLKRYGVIAVPELTGWHPLTAEDRYLVVASDGIFESLSLQDVSDIIQQWSLHFQESKSSELLFSCSSSSLAECIVKTAYERGSMDNLSVIVVPLRSMDFSNDQ